MIPLFADLSSLTGEITAAALILAFIAVITVLVLLFKFSTARREMVSGFAADIKRELANDAAPMRMDLKQPFEVVPGARHVDRETFDKEIKNAHGRITRERQELDAEIAELRKGLERISSEGEARDVRIHDRIDTLADELGETPRKTVDLLRATKGLL
jgi:hypothetical protein